MKVTVLSDNTSKSGLATEHGLSLYIETNKHRILFDFGASDLFVKNAERLGIDLTDFRDVKRMFVLFTEI